VKATIRALIVLFVLCVFLAALYALLPGEKAPQSAGIEGPASPDESFTITDIPSGEIRALAISGSRGSFGVINRPEGPALVDAEGVSDAGELGALLYLAGHLSGTRRLDALPLSAADIANSLVRITLILEGGSERRFAVLRKSPLDDGYLLFSEDEQRVYLIPESSAEWFLR
jgi:hypothetical protein